MRNLGLLGTRMVVGGYLAAHGAQKLFGSFGGHGLEATAKGFESVGLRPGTAMATLAGASELGGGVLTALGIADPVGPVAIAGTMAVATAVHRKQGPMAQDGGFEMPLVYLAVAAGLAAVGPGRLRLGPAVPASWRRLVKLGAVAGAALAVSQILRAPSTPPDGDDLTEPPGPIDQRGGAE